MDTILHINVKDTSKQSELLANIQNLMEDQTIEVDRIKVVINSDAIDMVKKGSEASEFIEEFLEKDVDFNACSNSLQNRDIQESDIIEGVKIVESAIGEINRLQKEGFNYLKI